MSRAEAVKEWHSSTEGTPDGMSPWSLRIIEKGDRYGRDDCLVHESEEPTVRFYNSGQFVSSYYLTTLLQVRGGLCLDAGVPAWTLDAEQMQAVIHDFLIPYTIARFLPRMSEPAPLPVSETSIMEDMSSIKSLSDEILGA